MKRELLAQVFGTLEVVSPITGQVTLVPAERHTSTLSVEQFSQLIDRTLEIAASVGEVLVSPEEHRRPA